ncbi:MAG: vitamin B12 dependent-methionine synthase activation domain-containing protein [Vicinamibacterales bacterium]
MKLYDNAQALLDRIVRERLLTARGVYGFWPAASEGDDIILFSDETRRGELMRFNMLRQQEVIPDAKPNLSLADFVADRQAPVHDYIGAFAVTAGLGADALARRFEAENDDYSAILVKALADRLAEAFAACLHARSRAEWGIDESASADDILHEKHRGIRPGFGYPACPDHSEKFKLFDLLQASEAGIVLTEHAAMTPAASVSGLYFAHPLARYFMVGRVGEDQVIAYARRKGSSRDDAERWLSSSLAYESARC